MYLNLRPLPPERSSSTSSLWARIAATFGVRPRRGRAAAEPRPDATTPLIGGSGPRYLTSVPTTQEEAASIVKRMAARRAERHREKREEEERLIRQGYNPETKSLPLGGDGMGYVPFVRMTREEVEEVQRRLSAHPEGAWQDYLRRAGEAPSAKE